MLRKYLLNDLMVVGIRQKQGEAAPWQEFTSIENFFWKPSHGAASEAESSHEFQSLVLEHLDLCEDGYGFPLPSLCHIWEDGIACLLPTSH